MLDRVNEFVAEPLPRKILFFDDMLTPSLIQVVYWLGLLAVIWTGLGHLFTNGFFGIFEGIVRIAIGAILLRVAAELVMLLFQIHENSEKMVANTEAAAAASKPRKTVAKKASKKVSKKPATD